MITFGLLVSKKGLKPPTSVGTIYSVKLASKRWRYIERDRIH